MAGDDDLSDAKQNSAEIGRMRFSDLQAKNFGQPRGKGIGTFSESLHKAYGLGLAHHVGLYNEALDEVHGMANAGDSEEPIRGHKNRFKTKLKTLSKR